MNKIKWLPAWLALVFSLLACNYATRIFTPATAIPDEPTVVSDTDPTAPPVFTNIDDITPVLEQLGGKVCEEQPEMTCVTIDVPLDHFDPANSETLQVEFAVLPAYGERHGMYVQAFPGGPGGEGISSAYVDYFDEHPRTLRPGLFRPARIGPFQPA